MKMDYLKQVFEMLDFASVETFIASGNVFFDAKSKDGQALERKIEGALKSGLGYEVRVFVRTEAELAAVATHVAFPAAMVEASAAFNVGFLAGEVDQARSEALMALQTPLDDFHVHGREVYWLSRVKQSESKITIKVFERALGMGATFRGINTVRRMTEKNSGAAKNSGTGRTAAKGTAGTARTARSVSKKGSKG